MICDLECRGDVWCIFDAQYVVCTWVCGVKIVVCIVCIWCGASGVRCDILTSVYQGVSCLRSCLRSPYLKLFSLILLPTRTSKYITRH